MFLCVVILLSQTPTLAIKATAVTRNKTISVTTTTTVAGEEIELQASVTYLFEDGAVVSDDGSTDVDDVNGSDETQDAFVSGDTQTVQVSYVLLLEETVIDNSTSFDVVRLAVGGVLSQPEDPVSNMGTFVGWYTAIDSTETFDFTQPITQDSAVYARWEIDVTDTDGDGIYDSIENEIGTDPTKADTDGDGLEDYIEKQIGTDPLLKDTDNNGISDYDEDADGDTLTNGQEVALGTNPARADSDFDDLSDSEEYNLYGTNPLVADTDGDGANDSWEIANGYDPTVYNNSFEVATALAQVSEGNPVVASVAVQTEGQNVTTLSVEPVLAADNVLVGSSIPGYLGTAYDFSLDGAFSSATLTFAYDQALYGEPLDTFQPRIYYFNESTQLFEELENQTISNGQISADTNHFSVYLLLNKVEYDSIWESEIKPLEDATDSTKQGLDIVLAIDSSGSMGWNDTNDLRIDAALSFISKLNEDDRAAIVDFDSSATTLCGLTSDKDLLSSAINQINSSGGTNISAPISQGISILTSDESSANRYKYIILLTDGDGTYSTSYSTLALENDIQIFTIGLGSSVDDSLLQEIADTTGGKYYFASSADDLLGIYDVTSSETIDYVTDSNNDGIFDYYTIIIYQGDMPMAQRFAGFDFSVSDDFDGDGLKNGEELEIVTNGTKVYVYMHSDPLLVHSDADGIDDYKEVYTTFSDPLTYSLSETNVSQLTNDGLYCAPGMSEIMQEEYSLLMDVNAVLAGVWNKDEIYRDIYIEYLSTYTVETSLETTKAESIRGILINTAYTMIDWLEMADDTSSVLMDLYDFVNQLNGITDPDSIYLMVSVYPKIVAPVIEIVPEAAVTIQTESISYLQTAVNVSDAVSKLSVGLQVVVAVVDVADTIASFATVNANNIAFNTHMDVLNELYYNSDNSYARAAAYDIQKQLQGDYEQMIEAVMTDLMEAGGDVAVTLLAELNIFTAAAALTVTALDLALGLNKTYTELFEMYSYVELATAYVNCFADCVVYNAGSYYELEEESYKYERYLTHLAQVRILGELAFAEVADADGIMGWFQDNSDTEQTISYRIARVKQYAELLGLTLHTSL